MDTSSLDLFIEVARLGSFAAVARSRNVDPSSVSRVIGQLEAQLGVRLFQRSTRRMVLSEAGEQLKSKLTPLMEELSSTLNELSDQASTPSGTLRITASVTFAHVCLLPIIAEFRERYPKITLECIFTDQTLDLLSERIDLAIRLGSTITGDLIVTKLMDTQYHVVASPAYLKNCPPTNVPADIELHDCLLFPERMQSRDWQFMHDDGSKLHAYAHGSLILSTGEALLEMAMAGAGPALLPIWATQSALEGGRLVKLFPDYCVSASNFDTAAWLVYPSKNNLPQKTRLMIDYLKEKLGSADRWRCVGEPVQEGAGEII
jgi:DNA-binding transcriptional LysR family regulator